MMVYRAMDTVARWGHAGPRAYALDTRIQNKTMLQWMDATSTYWQQLLSKTHNAADGHNVQAAATGTVSSKCANLSGTYYGGSKGGALETNWPISITQTAATTLQAHWPHGCAVGFWCDAHAILQPDGSIDAALFTQAGKPYPVHVSNWLNGTVDNCDTFSWGSTHTLWCRNGSSTACTIAPAPPPDGLADYGGASNLLECVPTYLLRTALSLDRSSFCNILRICENSSQSGSQHSGGAGISTRCRASTPPMLG